MKEGRGREKGKERVDYICTYMIVATVSYQSCTDLYTLSALYCMAHGVVS